MISGLGVYNNKVCEVSDRVWKYEVVVKSIEKAIGFRKVVIITEKPMGFIDKKTCLTRYSKKSGLLTLFFFRNSHTSK